MAKLRIGKLSITSLQLLFSCAYASASSRWAHTRGLVRCPSNWRKRGEIPPAHCRLVKNRFSIHWEPSQRMVSQRETAWRDSLEFIWNAYAFVWFILFILWIWFWVNSRANNAGTNSLHTNEKLSASNVNHWAERPSACPGIFCLTYVQRTWWLCMHHTFIYRRTRLFVYSF